MLEKRLLFYPLPFDRVYLPFSFHEVSHLGYGGYLVVVVEHAFQSEVSGVGVLADGFRHFVMSYGCALDVPSVFAAGVRRQYVVEVQAELEPSGDELVAAFHAVVVRKERNAV